MTTSTTAVHIITRREWVRSCELIQCSCGHLAAGLSGAAGSQHDAHIVAAIRANRAADKVAR